MSAILSTTRTLTLGMSGHETEVAVDVSYTYSQPRKGSVERGTGLPLEPDSAAEVELHSVLLKKGNTLLDISSMLSGEHVATIEQEIADEIES